MRQFHIKGYAVVNLRSGEARLTEEAPACVPGDVPIGLEITLEIPDLAAPPTGRAPQVLHYSPRELSVLRLLGEGKFIKEMAATLGYSHSKVKRILCRLYRKLGVESAAHAVAEGFRRGLL